MAKSSEDYYFKNLKLIDKVTPEVLRYVLCIGCILEGEETFYHKMKNAFPTNKAFKKRLFPEDLKKLKANNLQSFDTTLLSEIINVVCDLSASPELIELKSAIANVKTRRNGVAHDAYEEKVGKYGTYVALEETRDMLLDLLMKGKVAYKGDEEDFDIKKCEIVARCKDIITSPLIVNLDEEDIINSCLDETKFRFNQLYSKLTPILMESHIQIELSEIFVGIRTMQFINFRDEKIINFYSLLNTFKEREPGYALISAPAGAGKTTLLMQLCNQWASDLTREFERLDCYKVVFFVECREQTINSLKDFFRIGLPYLFNLNGFKYDDFLNALKKRQLLFLIDGLDEVNENSEKLLHEIKREFSDSHILITSRPEGEEFLNLVKPSHHSCQRFRLDGITDENMITFANKYWDNLPSPIDDEDEYPIKDDLLNVVQNISEEIREILKLPMYLSLYVYLFKTTTDTNLSNLKLGADLIHIFNELHIKCLREKFKDLYPTSRNYKLELKIRSVVHEIEEMAFVYLVNDRLTLSRKDYDNIIKTCEEKSLNHPDKVISSFITYKAGHMFSQCPTYTFSHKQHQEYLAARYIQRQLETDARFLSKYMKKYLKLLNCVLILVALITLEENDEEQDCLLLDPDTIYDIIEIVFHPGSSKCCLIWDVKSFLQNTRNYESNFREQLKRFTFSDMVIQTSYIQYCIDILDIITPKKIQIDYYNYEVGDSFNNLVEQCKLRLVTWFML